MATISTSGISTQQIIRSEHLLRIINALNGVNANDIIITGPLNNGLSCIATGSYSHAEGLGTIAQGDYQHTQGAYNISLSSPSSFIIGNGTSAGNRSNLVFASGSTFQVTGSLQVLGSITGSLFGTASYATSSSRAVTASYALNSVNRGPISVTSSTLYSTNPAAGPGFSTNNSIFLGFQAGYTASGAYFSNFFGQYAGQLATNAFYSNFLGNSAGYSASSANYSNFLGLQAGQSATNANSSNFLGLQAGYQATSANSSNFFGSQAGQSATNANSSNFLGPYAGYQATSANSSNFLGNSAGYSASSANSSNFLGPYAGYQATNASYSTLIGYQAGYNAIGSIGSNNIIIGTNITLATQQKDSINLGGIIFATGSYSTISGNSFSGSVSGAKVGIGTSTPLYTLDVSGSTRINDILILEPRTTTPTGQPTGSFIVSGSGANCKPYFYNGTTWTPLF